MDIGSSKLPASDSSPQPASSGPMAHYVAPWEPEQHQVSSMAGETDLEEAMWGMPPQRVEGVEAVYPQRPDEPDCTYYMRTGLCGFGANCKFNHPPSRRLAVPIRSRGEYPDRPGQRECEYYLKTGTCKFGASCKYHHPRERAATAGRAQLNALNFPLRPGEKDCAYYLRTGNCKFGTTCKFNHPPLMSMPSSPMFLGAPSGSASVPQVYPTGLPAWSISRPPVYFPSPRLAGASNFAPILVPPAQVPVPQWNPYAVPLQLPEGQQQALPGSYMYGTAVRPQEPVAAVHLLPPFMPAGSGSLRLRTPQSPSASVQREDFYPERPGEQECQYYMRTGDCKFGPQCRFHHPKDRNTSSPATLFTASGLPLRRGAPPCTFYGRFGYCKFGATCKFDHSFMPTTLYSPVGTGMPQYTLGTLSASIVPISPEVPLDAQGQTFSRDMLEEGEHTSAGLSQGDVQRSIS